MRRECAAAVQTAAGGDTEGLDAALGLLRALEDGLVGMRDQQTGAEPTT